MPDSIMRKRLQMRILAAQSLGFDGRMERFIEEQTHTLGHEAALMRNAGSGSGSPIELPDGTDRFIWGISILGGPDPF